MKTPAHPRAVLAAALTLLAVTIPSMARARSGADAGPLGHEVGIRLLLGMPTGEFGDAVDNPGFGLAAHYGFRPVPALTIGVGGDVMIYGSEKRTYRLPLVEDFDLTTNNNLAGFGLFMQWRPVPAIVQPYVEGRIGFRYLWTESKLEDKDFFDDSQIARETNYDDFASFWGGGGGLLVQVHEGDPAEKSPSVFLDFKLTHLEGSNAEYLTEGDVTIVNDVPVFDASESETDITTYELGVVLTF